jgi:hypothetical protein
MGAVEAEGGHLEGALEGDDLASDAVVGAKDFAHAADANRLKKFVPATYSFNNHAS